MNSDTIFSYVGKLLAVLSLGVLLTVGYSAYKLIPLIYTQQPEMGFNGTHEMIKGIILRNDGLYPINFTLVVKSNGRIYSSSVMLNLGESKELKLAVPISALLTGNASLILELIPFIEAEIFLLPFTAGQR